MKLYIQALTINILYFSNFDTNQLTKSNRLLVSIDEHFITRTYFTNIYSKKVTKQRNNFCSRYFLTRLDLVDF